MSAFSASVANTTFSLLFQTRLMKEWSTIQTCFHWRFFSRLFTQHTAIEEFFHLSRFILLLSLLVLSWLSLLLCLFSRVRDGYYLFFLFGFTDWITKNLLSMIILDPVEAPFLVIGYPPLTCRFTKGPLWLATTLCSITFSLNQ